jgi:hypothetical protein
VIYQDAPHHLGRDPKELSAVLPIRAVLIDQTQVRLVKERRRLERMARAFASKVGGRPPAQLLIHEGHELVTRGHLARAPRMQEGRDIAGLHHQRPATSCDRLGAASRRVSGRPMSKFG